MIITTDKHAEIYVGHQAYIFNDNVLTPTFITNIVLTKTFSGMGEPQVEATIVTAIGEFPSNDVYLNKNELIEYIDNVIGRTE